MGDPAMIISDEEIARVHGNANFGAMTPREVVNDGVRKSAVGYHCGSTMLAILREHGLITKPRLGSSDVSLTKKGKAYARALWPALAAVRVDPEPVAWQKPEIEQDDGEICVRAFSADDTKTISFSIHRNKVIICESAVGAEAKVETIKHDQYAPTQEPGQGEVKG